jgi:hypothetical protein
MTTDGICCGDNLEQLYIFVLCGALFIGCYFWVGGFATTIVLMNNQYTAGSWQDAAVNNATAGTVSATGVPATYCSANANTPACCETVWWTVCSSILTPILYIPVVLDKCFGSPVFGSKGEGKSGKSGSEEKTDPSKLALGVCCIVGPQLIALGLGASIITR